MSDIKHEAFLDLEAGLEDHLQPAWAGYWSKAGGVIARYADAGEWSDAHAAVNTLDLTPLIEKKRKLLTTIGMAAVLLGVSRVSTIEDSAVRKDPPHGWVGDAVEQAVELVGTLATAALKDELHALLDQHEYAADPGNSSSLADVRKADTLGALITATGGNRGIQYLGLAANLHVSRLSTAGFLLEATEQRIEVYQISAALDKRTCYACEKMHGQTFPVASGLAHMGRVFSARGSAALKATAPFISQTKAGLARLGRMSGADLLDAGIDLPPFHPRCRCIAVPAGSVTVADALATGLLTGAAAETLTERLFGPAEDADETAEAVSDAHDPDAGGDLLAGALAGATAGGRPPPT